MILEQATREIEKSQLNESSFGIDEKSQVHIIYIIRNKMYSDKIGAVVREYFANAVDANIEAGNANIPVEIKLPSAFSPEFYIRDFGNGLTDDEIRQVYVMYGASTKRASNDAIGQLGLGSKSAFAYTDSFSISSYKDGIESMYSAYIDETEVGKIALLARNSTTEKNGIKISISVLSGDFREFEKKTLTIAYYARVKPTIIGFDPEKIRNISDKNNIIMDLGDGRRVILGGSHNSTPQLVMGGIPYPFNPYEAISDLSYRDAQAFNNGIVLCTEIGAVSISASREALEYTKKTKETSSEILLKLKIAAQSFVSSEVLKEPDLLSAKKKFMFLNKSSLTEVKDLKYGNFDVALPVLSAYYDGKTLCEISAVEKTWRRCRTVTRTCQHFSFGDLDLIGKSVFINDEGEAGKKKASKYVSSGKMPKIILITKSGDPEMDKILESVFGFSEIFTRNISELDPLKDITLSGVAVKKRVKQKSSSKHSKPVFSLNYSDLKSVHYSAKSNYWNHDVIDISQDDNFYVEIDSFRPKNSNGIFSTYPDLLTTIKFAIDCNILSVDSDGKLLTKIYGIKTKMVEKAKEKLKTKRLYEEVKRFLTKDSCAIVKSAERLSLVNCNYIATTKKDILDRVLKSCPADSFVNKIDSSMMYILERASKYISSRGMQPTSEVALKIVAAYKSCIGDDIVSCRVLTAFRRLEFMLTNKLNKIYPISKYITPFGLRSKGGSQIGKYSWRKDEDSVDEKDFCVSVCAMEKYYKEEGAQNHVS